MFRTSLIIAALSQLLPHPAAATANLTDIPATQDIDGPVRADIIRVIDGDTILVSAKPWPQQSVEVYVRLRGIDAPELKAPCASAREAARQARDALSGLVLAQPALQLMHISADKYFGRVVADIALADGRDPARELLSGGFATPYDGGAKTSSCSSFW